MGRLNEEFIKAGAQILVILGDSPERARQYAETLKTPFPVLSDPDRAVYQLFGLDKVAFVIQRTASVVMDRDGLIQYIKRSVNAMTWLQESRELLEFVKGMESKP